MTNQHENGRDEMREQIVALIAHHMHTARVFHGKNSEDHLRYKNLIAEIRMDHEHEFLSRINYPQD
jgi:hypothetical protein